MLCYIYKSLKKEQTYLYIAKRDKFENVPEQLLAMFGKPELLMTINLAKQIKLAIADIDKVREAIRKDGFYLQLPPPVTNELEAFKASKGIHDPN
ncbi:YcgL domain-containing protein [Celerinatantimonas diazotrophica]|uniref:YcgL domain-containing protein EV690_2658 n=1 Tax=Celerinatantimonas diazotrophica TaxID=412034 RepID=A0A4V2PNM1_9GAMM|nr:YcgL domain-containing protein [Celerinatantimonas diazotrophica]TCK47621.1 hypothetical protein EV690_2658 [Celerinatantimonas diazotrophica]CAG9296756.1 Protein YcgL [Celerinatantimonas diazotrophica]